MQFKLILDFSEVHFQLDSSRGTSLSHHQKAQERIIWKEKPFWIKGTENTAQQRKGTHMQAHRAIPKKKINLGSPSSTAMVPNLETV